MRPSERNAPIDRGVNAHCCRGHRTANIRRSRAGRNRRPVKIKQASDDARNKLNEKPSDDDFEPRMNLDQPVGDLPVLTAN
jgi:hypothetical protein